MSPVLKPAEKASPKRALKSTSLSQDTIAGNRAYFNPRFNDIDRQLISIVRSQAKTESSSRSDQIPKPDFALRMKIEPSSACRKLDRSRSDLAAAVEKDVPAARDCFGGVLSFEVVNNNCVWFAFETLQKMQAYSPDPILLQAVLGTEVARFHIMREKPHVEIRIAGTRAPNRLRVDESVFAKLGINKGSYTVKTKSNRICAEFDSAEDAWKVIEWYEKNPSGFVRNYCTARPKAIDVRAFPAYCATCSGPGHMKEACKTPDTPFCGKCAGPHTSWPKCSVEKERCRTCILEGLPESAASHAVWSGKCQAKARLDMLHECSKFDDILPDWVNFERMAALKRKQAEAIAKSSASGGDTEPVDDTLVMERNPLETARTPAHANLEPMTGIRRGTSTTVRHDNDEARLLVARTTDDRMGIHRGDIASADQPIVVEREDESVSCMEGWVPPSPDGTREPALSTRLTPSTETDSIRQSPQPPATLDVDAHDVAHPEGASTRTGTSRPGRKQPTTSQDSDATTMKQPAMALETTDAGTGDASRASCS
ncbi:DNA-dependent RNA polymerase ii largest subunit [Colletotrichum higginsianum]|nr:DNA-dependent RNA polymerase ii largest subunit [Colletotrichum higginsianum]